MFVVECGPRIAMSRLVDYFVIVGFDHEKESEYLSWFKVSSSTVLKSPENITC